MRRTSFFLVIILLMVFCLAGCDDDYDLDDQAQDSTTRLHTEKTYFKDQRGRYFYFHGVNVSGSTKFPATDDPISYIGKPFPLDEADKNFAKLRDLGFTAIRLLVIWEAVEPEERGVYDQAYLDYLEQIVAKANEYGIYCLIDFHQDLFSRWMQKKYNDQAGSWYLIDPDLITPASAEPLNNIIRGDGAPRWAVQLCLPDKDVYSPEWGLPRSMASDPKNTSDLLPIFWGVNAFISVDISRCFLTFLAGRDVYPNYMIDGQNIQDYLQDAYAGAWKQVAMRLRDYPNVIGYDIINEPLGLHIVFLLYALLAQLDTGGELTPQQVEDGLDQVIDGLLALNVPLSYVERMEELLRDFERLPVSWQDIEDAGIPVGPASTSPFTPDLDAALSVNTNFNRRFLQPFYSKIGKAIQEVDPDAILFLEPSLGADDQSGILGMVYFAPMLWPDGLNQIAYAPHFYTDVYPIMGVNADPREFTQDEVAFRDYTEGILDAIDLAAFGLGNPPVVLGEFGTYWNFGGFEQSDAEDFVVSATIVDNYYEVLDEHLIQRSLWCYSPENTPEDGEGWNKEDFSILDPDEEPRGYDAYSRVIPRFTSGRLLEYHYNSPLAYYEPRPGVPTPVREFTMTMAGLESSAPTEIVVPPVEFPDGFYVYISSGRCDWDNERNILYWYPSDDDPDTEHQFRLRPPWPDYGDKEWNYFIEGDKIVEGVR